jgi:hypothetical protein
MLGCWGLGRARWHATGSRHLDLSDAAVGHASQVRWVVWAQGLSMLVGLTHLELWRAEGLATTMLLRY